ncbi:MAG TPA: CotH kinase family protein [Candidatus Limnocylindria bacterium]|nr:CotH kinase family protein [Candidatus Limnocylindria bacterium]
MNPGRCLLAVLLTGLLSASIQAEVVISEFMAVNDTTLKDSDAAWSDWIELHNNGDASVNLEGWFLTDSPTNHTRWRLPSLNLNADGYLIVYASGKNRTSPGLHTNFKLKSGGGYLALVKPDGSSLATEFATYPPQFSDVSYGYANEKAGTMPVYFERPTAGIANYPGWPSIAGKVDFSPAGGLLTNTISLTLTSDSPGAEIHYTLDGTLPTTNSPLFSAPITVNRTLQVRARAFVAGQVPGPLCGAGYTLVGTTTRGFSSNLPLFVLDTYGRTIAEGSRIPCRVSLVTNANGGRSSLTAPLEFQGRGSIEIRGSSSTQFPKKSYGLEIDNEAGADSPAPLLGLAADSDWVLYAPYTDKSLIRDVLAYELSNRIGRYAPQTRLVELYLNRDGSIDAADYQGVYVLVEKLKGGKGRVGITGVGATDYTEPDITGGFILKKDRFDSTDAMFTTPHGQQLGFEWPKPRDLGAVQLAWMRSYLARFETALYGITYRDPLKGYAPYIDADSFIDHHWLVEVAKNIDGFRLSTFMYKERNQPMHFGPLWDYNLTFGNANYSDGWLTNGWYASLLGDTDYPWFRRLFQDPDFSQRYTDRWLSLRTNVLATANVLALVSGYTNQLAEAQQRNYVKWPILGTYVWPNYYVGKTYADEIGFLKQWITGRLGWIDSTMVGWPSLSVPQGYYPGGTTVTLKATNTIYYTLDGTDPRAPGGSLSATAARYSTPLSITNSTRVIARARYGTRWSAPMSASYSVAVPALRITELMYHPAATVHDGPFSADEFEFIELRNVGIEPLPLAGFVLSGGVDFTFPTNGDLLLPGENGVLVGDRTAFVARYGERARILGEYSGKLSNSGEQIVLTGPLGEPVHDFTYSDAWQPSTDGQGWSLTVARPDAATANWSLPGSWKASAVLGGTPGWDDAPDTAVVPLRVKMVGQSSETGIIEFEPVAGRTYTLQIATDLAGTNWSRIADVPASTPDQTIRLPLPDIGGKARFFRLVTPRTLP